MRVFKFMVVLALLIGVAPAVAAPPCWFEQAQGTGSRAYVDTNAQGGALLFYCPPVSGVGPWTPEGFYGNWSEIPGGAIAAAKLIVDLPRTANHGTLAAMWDTYVKAENPGQDYTSVYALFTALRATHDPHHLPQPAPPRTTAVTAVYMNAAQRVGGIIQLNVGTVPANTPCDPKQQTNGRMAVPTSLVTWNAGVTARPLVVFADGCRYASP